MPVRQALFCTASLTASGPAQILQLHESPAICIWWLGAPHGLCDVHMLYCRHHSPPQGPAPAPPPGGCPSATSAETPPAQLGAPSRAATWQRQFIPSRTARTGSSSMWASTACTESTTQSACGPAWLLQLQTQQVGLAATGAAVLEAAASLPAQAGLSEALSAAILLPFWDCSLRLGGRPPQHQRHFLATSHVLGTCGPSWLSTCTCNRWPRGWWM